MESGTAMKEFQSDNEHGINSAKEADERKKSPLLLLLIEIVLFVTAVVLVVAAFSTPAIFHFTVSVCIISVQSYLHRRSRFSSSIQRYVLCQFS